MFSSKYAVGILLLSVPYSFGYIDEYDYVDHYFENNYGGNPGDADLGTDTVALTFQAGRAHVCAETLNIDGNIAVKCWGAGGPWLRPGETRNRGDHPNEMGDNLEPVDLPIGSIYEDHVHLATGHKHTCALLSNHQTVECWGRPHFGAIGSGNLEAIPLGTEFGQNLYVEQLVAGGYHNCALFENGRVKCWGLNNHGQLGYGDKKNRGKYAKDMGDNLPYIDFGTDDFGQPLEVYAIAAGFLHNCAIFTTGQIKCWGYNKWGSLGLGHREDRGTKPQHMGDNLGYASIYEENQYVFHVTAGKFHTCVVQMYGDVVCWGYNANGELGTNDQQHIDDTSVRPVLLPLPLMPVDNEFGVSLDAGYHHTCALFINGKVACWGDNEYGQLGVGDMTNRGMKEFGVDMGFFLPFVNTEVAIEVTCGEYFCCVLTEVHDVTCWGRNDQGQLGRGDKKHRGDEPGELPPGRTFSMDVIYPEPDNVHPAILVAMDEAIKRWTDIVTSDFIDLETGPVPLPLSDYCYGLTDAVLPAYYQLDDMVIGVQVGPIDDVLGTLAFAGNCLFFPESAAPRARLLPRGGFMRIDEADLDAMIATNSLVDVLTHELGHVLGIGSLWDAEFTNGYESKFIEFRDGDMYDPIYTGKEGKYGLRKIGGEGYPEVANTGANGTFGGHWRESTYGNELMTGYINLLDERDQPISALTANSLVDLGFSINKNNIEDFNLNDLRRRLSESSEENKYTTDGDAIFFKEKKELKPNVEFSRPTHLPNGKLVTPVKQFEMKQKKKSAKP